MAMRRMTLPRCLDLLLLAVVKTMTQGDLEAGEPTVMEPKYKVRVERNVMVPTRHGARLAADLIRPDADGRFPAIIEYIPYRKDDLTQGGYDAHYYFAERG